MSEMVERVAMALCARVALDGGTEWDDSTEHQKNTYRGDAIAMIESMLDPTAEMQTALGHAYREGLHMREVWNAGINEALK